MVVRLNFGDDVEVIRLNPNGRKRQKADLDDLYVVAGNPTKAYEGVHNV